MRISFERDSTRLCRLVDLDFGSPFMFTDRPGQLFIKCYDDKAVHLLSGRVCDCPDSYIEIVPRPDAVIMLGVE